MAQGIELWITRNTIQTSKTCYLRYLGKTRKVEIYKTLGMDGTYKRTLHFRDKTSCEAAVQKGFTYYPKNSKDIKYDPKGSSSPKRFIKDCESNFVVVCEPHTQGEQFTEEVL